MAGVATSGLDTGPRRLLLAWHASLLVITALFIVAIRNNQLLASAFNPPPLSYSFEGWAGQDAPLTAVEADLFGTERLVKRIYGRDDQIVELIISTSLPERRFLHDPAGCYVAAGGRVLERWTTRLPGADGAAAVEVGELLVAGPDTAGKGERLRCRFWFVREDGRTLGRGYDLILSTMWDRLRLRPQRQWRLFSLATPVRAGEEARGGRTLEAFTDALRRAAATRPTPRSKAAS